MAWTNAGYWEQSNDTARLSMARAFLTEVNSAITADVSADGKSRSSAGLMQLRESVLRDIALFERRTGQGGRGPGVLNARLVR